MERQQTVWNDHFSVETAKECEFNIKFDPTLVRGQSYYTGTIFEVTMDDSADQ